MGFSSNAGGGGCSAAENPNMCLTGGLSLCFKVNPSSFSSHSISSCGSLAAVHMLIITILVLEPPGVGEAGAGHSESPLSAGKVLDMDLWLPLQ